MCKMRECLTEIAFIKDRKMLIGSRRFCLFKLAVNATIYHECISDTKMKWKL